MNHQFVIDTNSLTPKTNLIEGWGNIVTREESTSDFGAMPGAPWMTAPRGITTRFDRLDGRYLPVYQCEQDLAFQRAEARVVAEVCPPAIGAMENLTNYTIGKGFTFTVGRDETADISLEEIQPLVKYTQRVVNEVIDSIKLCGQLDREIHAITREDGETFLNLKLTHEGTIMCQRLWPDQVTEPANFRQLEEYLGIGEEYPISWLFGIGTKEGLPELPLWYHVLYNDTGTDWDCIPDDRMVHIKANVPRSAKRGISDYYPVTTWFRKDHKLANNLSETGTIQAAIAFIRQHAPGMTANGVQNLTSGNKTSQGTVQGSTGNQVRNAIHYPAGSIIDIAAGMQYFAGPTGMGSANPYLLLIQDATLRRIGVRWQMPEYMISGNAANADYSCHDTETELLTKRGWLKYSELTKDDVAGTVNPETQEFEWQAIEAIHIHNYDGEMIRLKSAHNLDVMVTPNHRMYVSKDQHRVVDGKLVRDGIKPFKFIRADEMIGNEIVPFACKPKDGIPVECFSLPAVENKRWQEYGEERTVPMGPFLSFLGWWVSEGYVCYSDKKYKIGIAQHSKNSHECNQIRECISGIKSLRLKEYNGPIGMRAWSCVDKLLGTWLIENCGKGAYEKRLPAFVNDLPASQQELILASLVLGDGHDRPSGASDYYSVSQELTDQVQSIAIQTGHVAHIRKITAHGVRTVSIRPAQMRLRVGKQHISRVPYNGVVWCVSVPNGLIITRRNGKSLIAGNSTKEAGGPFVKAREADQVFYGRHYEELLWKSLKLLFHAGKFDQFGRSWQQFKAMLRINVGYPMVASKDPYAMAQAQSLLIDKRVMSPRTAAEQQGLDYDQEIENGLAPDPNQPMGSTSEDGTSPSGELVGMKLRDATNLDKLRKKYLDAFKAGTADEKETRLSLDSLGYSKEKIDLYLDADPANDPVDVTEAADLVQEKPAEHEYSSTQFNIADGSYTRTQGGVLHLIRKMSSEIPDEDLADDGRESEPHVTVKYGIHSNTSSAIRDAVKGFGPVEIYFRETSVFYATKDRDYDVVKIDIESPDLHRLNKLIADSTETTDTHPEYKPHVTLAYVKPGMGNKYSGLDTVNGLQVICDQLTFSNKNREHITIDLIDHESELKKATSAFQEALEEIKADPWKGYP